MPSRVSGEGAEVGGKEKAVSSNPSTRGATEQDAFLSAKPHRAGLGKGGDATRRLGVGVVTDGGLCAQC